MVIRWILLLYCPSQARESTICEPFSGQATCCMLKMRNLPLRAYVTVIRSYFRIVSWVQPCSYLPPYCGDNARWDDWVLLYWSIVKYFYGLLRRLITKRNPSLTSPIFLIGVLFTVKSNLLQRRCWWSSVMTHHKSHRPEPSSAEESDVIPQEVDYGQNSYRSLLNNIFSFIETIERVGTYL